MEIFNLDQKGKPTAIDFKLMDTSWLVKAPVYLLGALLSTVFIDGASLLTGSPKRISSAFSIRCLTTVVSTDRSW